jgi:hypothetical protein
LDEAKNQLEEYKNEIEKIKNEELNQHKQKEITRNDIGQPIINIKNKAGETVLECLVDEDNWHDLTNYTWTLGTLNYVNGYVNGKTVKMHRYIMNAEENDIIDHINGIVYDNRKCNLRKSTHKLNAHNRRKTTGTSSQYIGVCKEGEKWRAYIRYDDTTKTLGIYEDEIKAAIAYNLKATEIYAEYANCNKIDIEIFNKYKDEVLTKIKQKIENKKEPLSKYRGVQKINRKIGARIIHKGKGYFLGYFENEIDAAKAYNAKRLELIGHIDCMFNVIPENT